MKQLRQKDHAAAFHAEFFGDNTHQRYAMGINELADAVADRTNLSGFIDDTTATHYRGKPIVQLSDVPTGSMVISTETAARPKTAINKLLCLKNVVSMDYIAVAEASQGKLPQEKAISETQKEFRANPEKFEWLRELFADPESREVSNRVMEFRLHANLRAMRFFDYVADQPYAETFLQHSPTTTIKCVDPEALEHLLPVIKDQLTGFAVPVWHTPAHFWQVPNTILTAQQDYKVYLRHYSEGWTGTVMFFMPSRSMRFVPIQCT